MEGDDNIIIPPASTSPLDETNSELEASHKRPIYPAKEIENTFTAQK